MAVGSNTECVGLRPQDYTVRTGPVILASKHIWALHLPASELTSLCRKLDMLGLAIATLMWHLKSAGFGKTFESTSDSLCATQ